MTSNDMIDEEGLQMLREEKLANILANDILEKDEIWIDYEWEETQVCLDMADMCLESLVSEIFYILNSN